MRLTAQALDGVFDRLGRDAAAGRIPVAALAIGDERGLIRKAVAGARAAGRRRRRSAIDDESLFFLASVTKPIFATAFMQLVEEGLLGLDDPLARWLPEFDTVEKRGVLVRHLLAHTSGIPDALLDLIRSERPSGAKLTRLALDAPLMFPPGTRWAYSSSTFYLLAEVARQLTGLTAAELMRQRLFEPLGMRDTAFDPRRRGRALVPVHGVGADNPIKRFFLLRFVVALAHPGGGLWGTLDDLVRFGSGLLAPRLAAGERWIPVSAETFALMSKDHAGGVPGVIADEERPVRHGLAWGKPTLNHPVSGSPRVVDHGGATGTRLWIDPDARLVFVYFTNQWQPDRGPEFAALRGAYEALGIADGAVAAADTLPVGG
ncbi:serine hydrolase domain-containing protein [soil metagenome]